MQARTEFLWAPCVLALWACTASGGLPNRQDIGNPPVPGAVVVDNDPDYTIVAGGRGVRGQSNQFFYAWDTWTGDFTAVVMVESISSADPDPGHSVRWDAEAGINVRVDANADAVNLMLSHQYGGRTYLFERRTTPGPTYGLGFVGVVEGPWLRLDRAGGVMIAYYGSDNGGVPNWSRNVLVLPDTAYPSTVTLGLATSPVALSANDANKVQAVYRDYSVTSYAGSPFQAFVPPADAPRGGMGQVGIREVIDNGTIADQDECLDSLSSGGGTIVDYTATVLNIHDQGGVGNFPDDSDYGVVTAGRATKGNVRHISVLVQGTIRIPEGEGGEYTFGVNSSDGFELCFPGRQFVSARSGATPQYTNGDRSLVWLGNRNVASDTLGVINLPAGDHPFWLTHHGDVSGLSAELFAAKGAKSSFSDEFILVGGVVPARPPVASPPEVDSPAGAGWDVVCIYEPTCATYQEALDNVQAYWGAGLGDPNRCATGVADSINYEDPDDAGGGGKGFAQNAFCGEVPGTRDDHFCMGARGTMHVTQEGDYAFLIYGDDGTRFRITNLPDPNEDLWTIGLGGGTGGGVISKCADGTGFLFDGWARDATGTIHLVPGDYDLEVIWQEGIGEAFVGLWCSVDGSDLFLLGDTTPVPGGPELRGLELVPEPSALALVALGGLAVTRWRRGR